MIEVLITMIIILVGLLGIGALQAKAQIAELESYQRAQGLILMSDIIDRMHTNRETISCFIITTNTGSGTPFIGAAGTGHASTPACAASTTEYNTQANDTITELDNLLKGSAETESGSNVGAMIGARACISYDSSTEVADATGAIQSGTGLYTIAVSWQALGDLTTPSVNCANGLYGAETKRRTISTTMRIADLY